MEKRVDGGSDRAGLINSIEQWPKLGLKKKSEEFVSFFGFDIGIDRSLRRIHNEVCCHRCCVFTNLLVGAVILDILVTKSD